MSEQVVATCASPLQYWRSENFLLACQQLRRLLKSRSGQDHRRRFNTRRARTRESSASCTYNESEPFILGVALDLAELALSFVFLEHYYRFSAFFFFDILCASTFGTFFENKGHILPDCKILATALLLVDECTGKQDQSASHVSVATYAPLTRLLPEPDQRTRNLYRHSIAVVNQFVSMCHDRHRLERKDSATGAGCRHTLIVPIYRLELACT